jgi:hypothetical protein
MLREDKTMNNKRLIELVDDMYWDYDRMSSSGQETLDKIADLLGIPANSEMKEQI